MHLAMKPQHGLPASGPVRAPQAGFSLIEFMIAVTLSVLVLAALSAAFVSSSRARTEIERTNQQIENGRYALQVLTDDLELAGYWGHFNLHIAMNMGNTPLGLALLPPEVLPDPCATDLGLYPNPTGPAGSESGTGLRRSLPLHVQGYNGGVLPAGHSCGALLDDHVAGTDILLIRRVRTCLFDDADCPNIAGAPYFQSSLCNTGAQLGSGEVRNHYRLDTNVANLNLNPRTCAGVAERRRFVTHIYFLAQNDQPGDGIPTLKRLELTVVGGNLGFREESIAQGIESLQLEYGIDEEPDTLRIPSGDGQPELFSADPGVANACDPAETPTAPLFSCMVRSWLHVVAVRVHLLARNPAPSPDHVDVKTYTLGFDTAGNPVTTGPFNDGFRRHAYSTTVRLMNPAARREL
jgi:type IV pilus assembly protein PilW